MFPWVPPLKKNDGEKTRPDNVKVTGFIPGIVAGVEVGIPAGPALLPPV